MKNLIFNWPLFIGVLIIAALQASTAWLSGHISIKSIKLSLRYRERRRYWGLTVMLAIFLFIVTATVGVLNDKLLRESDRQQTFIERKIQEVGPELTGLDRKLDNVQQRLRTADDKQGLTPVETERLKSQVSDIRQDVGQIHRDLGSIIAKPAAKQPDPPRSSPQPNPQSVSPPSIATSDIKSLPSSLLKTEARKLAIQLRQLNEDYAQRDRAIKESFRGKIKQYGQQWGSQKDSPTQSGDNYETYFEIPISNNIRELADIFRKQYQSDVTKISDELIARIPGPPLMPAEALEIHLTYAQAAGVDSRSTFHYDVRNAGLTLEKIANRVPDEKQRTN